MSPYPTPLSGSLELTLEPRNFSRRQTQVKARLRPINLEIAATVEWELSGTIWPEGLHRLQLSYASDVGQKTHCESEKKRMLGRVNAPEPNLPILTVNIDRVHSRLGTRLARVDIANQRGEQGVRMAALQPEKNELGMATGLH